MSLLPALRIPTGASMRSAFAKLIYQSVYCNIYAVKHELKLAHMTMPPFRFAGCYRRGMRRPARGGSWASVAAMALSS